MNSIARNPALLLRTVERYAPKTKKKLKPLFKRRGLSYPAGALAFIVYKKEKKLELWASKETIENSFITSIFTVPKNKWVFIKNYKIKKIGSKSGPKLRQGDKVTPEGIYKITYFNPRSRYHLSLAIDYPNEFDRKKALLDNRKKPGFGIMIHGKNISRGCVAIGNKAIEELFVLAYKVGLDNIKVIIAPHRLGKRKNFRKPKVRPKWVKDLYKNIIHALKDFR